MIDYGEKKITNRQKDVLEYIKKYIVEHGFPPSTREIGDALGMNSPATVHTHLTKLEENGWIRKTDSKFRTIEIVGDNEYAHKDDDVVEVPLLGLVACGNPIEAIENPDDYFPLPINLVPKNKTVITLRCEGESMINKGILDGDIVVVQLQETAHDGDIVVARTDDGDVTLKTFYKRDGYIELKPENDTMKPFKFEHVTIIGKAIGLYREF
jgi:repressor LexA